MATRLIRTRRGCTDCAWLSLPELDNRHYGVRTIQADGVGYLLLETTESGCKADKSSVFCFGNLGAGKTYLRWASSLGRVNITNGGNFSSLAINHLCDKASEEDITVTYLYYGFLTQHEQTLQRISRDEVGQMQQERGDGGWFAGGCCKDYSGKYIWYLCRQIQHCHATAM